ncbi:MAG TPA: cyclic nucleotide-binding domain-containing protein [Gaiella sp.]
MVDAVELRAVALFGSLDDQELESLASCAELVEIPSEGVDLTRQGDFGHAVFAVVGGTADVTVDGSPVRQLGRGDVFGEIAVLSSGRRTATVTSTSPMRLVSLFKRDLWRFADANPGFDDALRQATIRS